MTQPIMTEAQPTFADLARDLRIIAELLEKAPHVTLTRSPYVELGIQPGGTDDEIIARTDAIGQLLFGKDGQAKSMGGDTYHYKVEGRFGLVGVGLYDSISAKTVRTREVAAGGRAAALAELERLRGEVAELEARVAQKSGPAS